MLRQEDMRRVINKVMCEGYEYHLHDIYNLFERHAQLDEGDMGRSGRGTNIGPKWKETVRRALYGATQKGQAYQPSRAHYIRTKQIQL